MSDCDRPAYACVTCRPPKTDAWTPAEHGWLICDHCYNRIVDSLAEISQRYLLLNAHPAAGHLSGSRGAPGFGSRSPASDHIIVMQDPRSGTNAHVWVGGDGRVHREDQNPPVSVYNVLVTHAVDVCELRGFESHNAANVHELSTFLTTQLDWVARQPLIADLMVDLQQLVRQLRPVTGTRRVWIGNCPFAFEDEQLCGERLYAPVSGDSIGCEGCSSVWSRPTWEELARKLTFEEAA